MTPDKYIKNYIGGKQIPADSGDYLDSLNPVTGKVYAHFPDSNEQDVQSALSEAQKASRLWMNFELEKRYRILMRLADILEQEMKVFAKSEAIDVGKPYSMAMSVDVPQAYSCLRFYATSLPHYAGQAYYQERHSIHYTIRRPLGVVACFPHWSFSLLSLCQLLAPALVAGNTVIVVAPELTPMSSYLLAKACIAAGVPPGVVNIVYGKTAPLSEFIFKEPLIKGIAYAGDAALGETLAKNNQNPFRKTSFSLAAKNPAIIFADCNFHKMIVETLRSSFSNNGQHPYSTSRLLVERTIYESFKEELLKRTQFLKIGDTLSTTTDLGAIISKEKLERLESYITLAELEGGKILCGGKVLDLNGDLAEGFFFRPALIEGLEQSSRINQEDIFGPIVTMAPFDNDEEALQMANASPYAKAASIWTQNTGRASKMAERLNAGIVWINSWMLKEDRASFTPFANSGNAPLGGMEALHFFTVKKTLGQPL